MIGPNFEKVRQVSINRTMHAEQLDKKANDQKKAVEPSNTIVVKKESKWKKFRDNRSKKKNAENKK